jgi:hypothetical protein
MSNQMTDDEIRDKARARVHAKLGFFRHLTVYIIVNGFLVIIWAMSSAGMWWAWWGPRYTGNPWPLNFWPAWVMVFWGIGLVAHCLSVFVFHGNWEESEVEKEMQRIRKNQTPE